MHNLALELSAQGLKVTGSDDEIYEPSKSRLMSAGLLPDKMGWYEENISDDIDLVILGMHARKDNPELIKAMNLGLRIMSFPEFVGSYSENKIQIVVAGSHGKTTTTSIIMHALKSNGLDFDYLVGAQLHGFDRMVRLSDAPIIVIEGDEYLSSPIDPQPKFLHYQPDLLIVTGMKWDHMNVFPTEKDYEQAFIDLFRQLKDSCKVYYDQADLALKEIVELDKWTFFKSAYQEILYSVENGIYYLPFESQKYPISLVGKHNMKNISAAGHVCREIGLSKEQFLQATSHFSGAAKRLDKIFESGDLTVFRDFAHAPSKVKATCEGIRELFPDRRLIALSELHTYSSLNKNFLPQYKAALDTADKACVFFSPHTLEIKRMPPLSAALIKAGFQRNDMEVITEKDLLLSWLIESCHNRPVVLLMMSSGTFGNLDLNVLLTELQS
jgi:UDP-N-acetylmuramate: L-alanyl-gamma-D-glutamyl-meso-diaminopimelate ligase